MKEPEFVSLVCPHWSTGFYALKSDGSIWYLDGKGWYQTVPPQRLVLDKSPST